MIVIGRIALVVALLSSLVLVFTHLTGLSVPGCGVESACGRLRESAYSMLPMPWGPLPVSLLGAAFFFGMLIASFGNTPGLRWLARLGMLASVGFVAVAVREQLLCRYCLAAHLGNAIFWLSCELRRDPQRSWMRGGAGAFAGLLLVLILIDRSVVGQTVLEQEEALQESIATLTETPPPSVDETPEPTPAAEEVRNPVVRGRWRIGPETARVRIVMFMGYQCQDCRRIDLEVLQLVRSNPDVSVSVRHFPLNNGCNTHISRAMHPNACWAARAAETAGWIGGDDGFFRMHEALFKRKGRFEKTEELVAAVREAQLDEAEFMRVFGDQALRQEFDARIAEDVEEGVSLGLFFTPMVFINGVELKGWSAPRAVSRAVQAVLESDVVAATDENDRPPRAIGKYVADWADGERVGDLDPEQGISLGPADAAVRVVLFGDYEDATTAEADALLRAAVATRGDLRYTWRHFPLDTDCNPQSPVDRNDACSKHEAAAVLASDDSAAFWELHTWLLQNQSVRGQALEAELARRGIDAARRSQSEGLGQLTIDGTEWVAIQDAAKRANRLHRKGLPTIILNGRIIPRWKRNGAPVMQELLEAAAGEKVDE